MIIGLIGKKGSGKTTASNVFTSKGFKIISFAYPLKDIVHNALGIPMDYLLDPAKKEQELLKLTLGSYEIRNLLSYASANYHPIDPKIIENILPETLAIEFRTPRHLLQWIGTELFRQRVDKDYWISVFTNRVKPNENYVCDDCRFLNEVKTINKLKGKTIFIKRPDLESVDTHASEQIDDLPYNYKITNYDLVEFKNNVELMLNLIMRYDSGQEVQRQE